MRSSWRRGRRASGTGTGGGRARREEARETRAERVVPEQRGGVELLGDEEAKAVLLLEVLELLGLEVAENVAVDDVYEAAAAHALALGVGAPRHLAALVHGVHREEFEDDEIDERRDDGEAEQDEREREYDVGGVGQVVLVLLEGDVVAEADGGERYDAEVDRVEVGPALVVGEHGRADGDREDGEEAGDHDLLELVHLGVLHAAALLHHLDAVGGEEVELVTDRLEHDETQRYADRRIDHAEHLAPERLRRAVAVADGGYHRQTEVESAGEFPIHFCFVVVASIFSEIIEMKRSKRATLVWVKTPLV